RLLLGRRHFRENPVDHDIYRISPIFPQAALFGGLARIFQKIRSRFCADTLMTVRRSVFRPTLRFTPVVQSAGLPRFSGVLIWNRIDIGDSTAKIPSLLAHSLYGKISWV